MLLFIYNDCLKLLVLKIGILFDLIWKNVVIYLKKTQYMLYILTWNRNSNKNITETINYQKTSKP